MITVLGQQNRRTSTTLSLQILNSLPSKTVQVMILGFWDQVPLRALSSAGRLLLPLLLPSVVYAFPSLSQISK